MEVGILIVLQIESFFQIGTKVIDKDLVGWTLCLQMAFVDPNESFSSNSYSNGNISY